MFSPPHLSALLLGVFVDGVCNRKVVVGCVHVLLTAGFPNPPRVGWFGHLCRKKQKEKKIAKLLNNIRLVKKNYLLKEENTSS